MIGPEPQATVAREIGDSRISGRRLRLSRLHCDFSADAAERRMPDRIRIPVAIFCVDFIEREKLETV